MVIGGARIQVQPLHHLDLLFVRFFQVCRLPLVQRRNSINNSLCIVRCESLALPAFSIQNFLENVNLCYLALATDSIK